MPHDWEFQITSGNPTDPIADIMPIGAAARKHGRANVRHTLVKEYKIFPLARWTKFSTQCFPKALIFDIIEKDGC